MTLRAGFKEYPVVTWLGPRGPLRVEEPVRYFSCIARRLFIVPTGTVTDLESRPTWLPAGVNWLLGRSLSTGLAAILHDYLYAAGPSLKPPVTRAQADAIYYEALRATDNGAVGAWIAWVGLRLGGGFAWRGHRESE